MPKYTFSACVTVSAYTTVEADSLEEATDMVMDRDIVLSPGFGSEAEAEDNWVIESPDGDLYDIHPSDIEE